MITDLSKEALDLVISTVEWSAACASTPEMRPLQHRVLGAMLFEQDKSSSSSWMLGVEENLHFCEDPVDTLYEHFWLFLAR